MRQELQDKIFKRWPEWFEYAAPAYREGAFSGKIRGFLPMAFGLEVGVGWYDLIWRCLTDIEKILGPKHKKHFRFHQIKEKFGGLRLYTGGTPCSKLKIVHWEVTSKVRQFVYKVFPSYPSRIAYNITKLIEAFDWPGHIIDRFDITERVEARIRQAERESYRTCELCGKPGRPNKFGWITTLCKGCRKMTDERKARGDFPTIPVNE